METEMQPDFVPILYLKAGCPHCFKLSLFLLESGLAGRFERREFAPGDEHEAGIRSELGAHHEKPTFPTVQLAPGRYMNESDDIVRHYAEEMRVDLDSLPLFRTYADKLLPRLRNLARENKALKAQLAEAGVEETLA
jgi:glutathione S-transferase